MTAWTLSPVWSYPEGVQESNKVDDFALSDTYNCKMCYGPTAYGAETSYADICDCAGPWLFVGTQDYRFKILPNKDGKGKTYLVGAFGKKSEICPTDKKVSYGVEWLVVPNQQVTFGQPQRNRRLSWQLSSAVDPAPPKIAQRPVAYGGKYGKFWNDNLLYKVVWSCPEPKPAGAPTFSPPPTTSPRTTGRPLNANPTSAPTPVTSTRPSVSNSLFTSAPTVASPLKPNPLFTRAPAFASSSSPLGSIPNNNGNAPTQAPVIVSSKSPSVPNAGPTNAPTKSQVSPSNLSGTQSPYDFVFYTAQPTRTSMPMPTVDDGLPTPMPTYKPTPIPTPSPFSFES